MTTKSAKKTKETTNELGFDPKLFVESIAHEKGLNKSEVYTALGVAIETAVRRDFPEGSVVTVKVNPEPFSIHAYRKYEIVDKVEDYEIQINKSKITTEIVENGFALEEFPIVIDRQKLNIVHQVIMQRLKNISRQNQINNLLSRKSKLFYGTVKLVKRDQVLLECEGLEVNMPRKNCIGREKLTVNQRIFFVLEEENGQYYATRASTEFLHQVLLNEIPSFEDTIEITRISRVAGFRSKVVVRSLVGGDPIKTCLGQGAKNLRAIQEYLGGEFVDFIEHKDDFAQILVDAFKPIPLSSIQIDEGTHDVKVRVADEDIGRAIGKFSNNIRLINGLTDYNVLAISESEWDKFEENDNNRLLVLFQNGLSCDEELAQMLIDNNFSSLEEVAYVPEAEFDIDVDEETLQALRSNARSVVENPEELKRVINISELAGFGFNSVEIEKLIAEEVFSVADLADLGTFDLQDILPETEEENARNLIMKARQNDPRYMDEVETITE